MIFVTVGTHELPFARLLAEVGEIASSSAFSHAEFFCQSGTAQLPPGVPGAPMLSFADMQERMAAASAVVSHGGPATIIAALAAGKPLVAVPRQRRYGEHVDDHQVQFCRHLHVERGLVVIEDVTQLGAALADAREGRAVAPRAGSAPQDAVAALGARIDALLGRGPSPG